MKNSLKDNTNKYISASNVINELGVSVHKKDVKNYLSFKEKHYLKKNNIYIHDQEFFDITLNCCSISIIDIFKNSLEVNKIKYEKPQNLFDIFTQLHIFIVNITNEISGGLTLVNFDSDLSDLIDSCNIHLESKELFFHLQSLFKQINFTNSRFGNQSPYVTLTIGIVKNEQSALICKIILDVLIHGSSKQKPFIFPNIIFRVKEGINKDTKDKFHYLYILSLQTTSKQMNPTYILADSSMNKDINPLHLHVVGCRSRLLKTRNEQIEGIGRANIGAVSINLPKLAMQSKNIVQYYNKIEYFMKISCNILIKKQLILKKIRLCNSPILVMNNILYPFNKNIDDILEEASLAIGFIGAHETADILLTNQSLYDKHKFINDTLNYMHSICEKLSKIHKKIVTLIGVSGENISYYFFKNDINKNYAKKYFNLLKKGFYTNSFHIPVNELVNLIKKIYIEGQHHKFCSGGNISYIEISHNKNNIEAFDDIIKIAENNNMNYLGFNFQKNICNNCGTEVESQDICDNCKSNDIIKIRRVSGYLGYLNSFSKGKAIEESLRIKHTNIINRGE